MSDLLLALGLALAFFALALVRLDAPDIPVFDEVYNAQAGMELAAGQRMERNVSHPPLVKEAIASAIILTRTPADPEVHRLTPGKLQHLPHDVVRAWRLPSALMGAIAVAALYGFARDLSGSWRPALAAAGLLALDGCFFVHARVAMTNVYEVAFVIIAAWSAWRIVARRDDRCAWVGALAVGAAIACRWSGVAPWLLLAAWVAWQLRQEAPRLLRFGLVWAALPPLVYAATYVPIMAAQGGLFSPQLWYTDFLHMNLRMFLVHVDPAHRHPFSSPWWSWPLMLRPVWYGSVIQPPFVTSVWAIGNAVVWWLTIPALLTAARAGWRGRADAGLLAVLGFGIWLFWAVQPRPMLFMHYFLTVIPFGCLAMALIGQAWWRGRGLSGDAAPIDAAASRAVVGGVLAAAVAWFVFYYPVLTAVTLTLEELQRRVWFGAAWL